METEAFKDRLVQAFKASGLTKEELWKRSGVSFYVIEQLLDGKITSTDAKNSKALASALGMDSSSQADTVTADRLKRELNAIKTAQCPAPYAEIGARLKSFREMLGLSQAQFCESLNGIGQGKYSRWEAGASLVPLKAALEIKRVHGLSLDVIYSGAKELDNINKIGDWQENSILNLFSMLSPEERSFVFRAIKGLINSKRN